MRRAIAPMVTWGTSLEDVAPIDGARSGPASAATAERRERMSKALDYMGLTPGHAAVGRSRSTASSSVRAPTRASRTCAPPPRWSNGRSVIPAWRRGWSRARASSRSRPRPRGSTGSSCEAGFEWREPGCSLCLGINGETVAAGQRCASTSNRNFVGRQGRGARTHLMSPPMAAAAAVTGHLTDVRANAKGRLSMEPFKKLRAAAVPDRGINVDTDQILPGALPVEAARRRLRAISVPRPAFRRQRRRATRLHPQPAGLPASAHPGRGTTISAAARRARMPSGRSTTMASAPSSRRASATSSTRTA